MDPLNLCRSSMTIPLWCRNTFNYCFSSMDELLWKENIWHWPLMGTFQIYPMSRTDSHSLSFHQEVSKLSQTVPQHLETTRQNDTLRQFLAKWCQQHFSLIATDDDGFDNLVIPSNESPCRLWWLDIPYKTQPLQQYIYHLIKFAKSTNVIVPAYVKNSLRFQ